MCYIQRYGAKQASLDLFRRFLQRLSDDDIDYGMRKKVIKEEDLLTASEKGDLQLSVAEKATRVIAGLGRPSLLMKLKSVAEYMKKIKEHYAEYPSNPEDLMKWKSVTDSLILEFNKTI